MNWRPIETAPKDGSFVLVYRESRQYVARWIHLWETWGVSAARIPGQEDSFTSISEVSFGIHVYAHGPTHWMPLPPAPAAAIAEGR